MKYFPPHHIRAAITVLALTIIYPSAFAQSNAPIHTFRGIELGSELRSADRAECPKRGADYVFPVGDDFKQQMNGRQCWATMNSFALKLSSPLFVLQQVHNVPQLPGMLSTVGTVVLDGRIEAMESLFGRESYLTIRDAMIEKYGPLDKEERVTFQNRLGATYVGRRATWTRQSSVLRIDEILEGSDLAAISLYSRRYLDTLSSSSSGARDSIKKGL